MNNRNKLAQRNQFRVNNPVSVSGKEFIEPSYVEFAPDSFFEAPTAQINILRLSCDGMLGKGGPGNSVVD